MLASDPAYLHHTVFQGLPENFNGPPVILREFIGEEHPVMRQGDFSRETLASASNQRRNGDGVVGASEGPHSQQPSAMMFLA